MNLSIRQLTTFREVMRSGSISRAAKTVGRTQPAVSTMIATLETELGFALFIREHGKLTPTPEAQFFLEEAEAILGRLERTKQTLIRIGSLETGRLRVACHPAASSLFMPRLLAGFLADKRDVDIALIMRSSDLIEDLVASQQFDLGFAETPSRRASISQVDFDLECVCILPVGDPLARLREITPGDLDGKPMAVLFEQHTTATQTEAAFASAGARFNKRLELRTSLPGLEFVTQGFCYMVCDMITAYSHILLGAGHRDLVMRRFRPRVSSSVSILRPAYASRARLEQAFSSHLTDAIQDMQAKTEEHLEKGPHADPDGERPA
ncbi:LysR substrate-binding domain-containing protein [Tropicimonas sp. IMCC6043]|uniref:LysR family transcriptional regulator n=1 Tax=Tropicimonas sp. IMCC6043 TaxID=2510645 RepID=UPI00101CF1BF|nr:LysR substrate-binding domain-containing protein [Tropicimonas sp. IMCC6043]RYH11620.1 LysR family transcriptional regulator [Tropicimonas sp. IMCC6043]